MFRCGLLRSNFALDIVRNLLVSQQP
jgi:hypothetical protein